MSKKSDFHDRLVDVYRAAGALRAANVIGVGSGVAYLNLMKAMDAANEALEKIALPEDGYVGSNHPETSRAAARRVAPKRGVLRHELWRMFVVEHGLSRELPDTKRGYTDHELHAILNTRLGEPKVDIRTVGSARISLRDQYSFIKDSGLRRRTPSGAEAIVWVLTDLGAEEWDKQERGE